MHKQEARDVGEQKTRRHHAKSEAQRIVIILNRQGRDRPTDKERHAKKLDEMKKVKQRNYFADATFGNVYSSRSVRISAVPWLSNLQSSKTPCAEAFGP